MSDEDLSEIGARARAASVEHWSLDHNVSGSAVVHVAFKGGSISVIRLTRDAEPASDTDVAFVAHSRTDLLRLVDAARGQGGLSAEDIHQIAVRCDQATPGPWRAFLEEDGGMAGCNVISVSDSDYEPDLYLWLDAQIAPGADYEFVAHARDDVPRLLAEIRR